MNNNDYYSIAYDDLLFLQDILNTEHFNKIAIEIQQIIEKLLKSVVERVATVASDDGIMRTHNLRQLYQAINKEVPKFQLNSGTLSIIKDYYFECKYPGDNYYKATKEDCTEALEMMYEVWKQVNEFRESLGLDVFDYQVKLLGSGQ